LPDSSLAGQEHGRTIPLVDMNGSELEPCKLTPRPHFAGRKSLL